MSRSGSRRGGNQEHYPQADGRTVNTMGASTKAGYLSPFGKVQQPSTFGPGSVFARKKEIKRESISRTNSSSNVFSMLKSTTQEESNGNLSAISYGLSS
jgi:translation initiation factor 4G